MPENESPGKEEGGNGQFKGFGVTVPLPKTFRAIDGLFSAPLDYAREALQAYIDRKKVENLLSHTEAVRKKLKARMVADQEPSVRQIELLDEWVQSAASFGEENPELAAAWRAVLEKIQMHDDDAEEILLALRLLTPSDIILFTKIHRNKNNKNIKQMLTSLYVYKIDDEPRLKRLIGVGLISDYTTASSFIRAIVFSVGTIFAVGIFVAYYLIKNNALESNISKYMPDIYKDVMSAFLSTIRNVFPILVIIIGIMFGVLIMIDLIIRHVHRYSLTAIGKKFLKSFETYRG
jgi:hypothetical protein